MCVRLRGGSSGGSTGGTWPPNLQWWRFSLVTAWYSAFKISKNRRKIAKKMSMKCSKIAFGGGSAPDPAGVAYDASPDPLVGWGGSKPPPQTPTPQRLRRLKTNVPPPQAISWIRLCKLTAIWSTTGLGMHDVIVASFLTRVRYSVRLRPCHLTWRWFRGQPFCSPKLHAQGRF